MSSVIDDAYSIDGYKKLPKGKDGFTLPPLGVTAPLTDFHERR